MRVDEDIGMQRAVDGVGAEQPAKEQDLRDQEDPDAQLPRVKLVFGRIEMMGEKRIGGVLRVLVPCAPDGSCGGN